MKRTILPIFAAMFLLMGTVYPPIISNVGRFFSVIVQYVTANYITVNSLTIGDGGTPIVAAHSAVICTTANQLAIDAGYISDAGWVGPGGAATLQVLSSAPECTAPWPVVFPCLCGPLTYGFGSGCPDGGTLGSLAGITSADAISCSPVSLQADAGAGLPVSMLAATTLTETTTSSEGPPVIVDLNGDGYPDILGVIASGTFVNLGNGNGTFAAAVTYTAGSQNPRFVTYSAFNGCSGGACGSLAVTSNLNVVGTIQLGINNGAGVFSDGGQFGSGTNKPRTHAVGNISGTGWGDIATGEEGTSGAGISVLINQGDGGALAPNFATAAYYDAGSGSLPDGVIVADFNNDGCADVAACLGNTPTLSEIAVWTSHCDGGLSATPQYFATSTTCNTGIVATSLTGSAYPDIIVAAAGSGSGTAINVLLNLTDGGATANFAAPVSYTVGSNPVFMAAADINGDGHQDVIVAGNSSNYISVLAGLGTGVLAAQVTFAATTPQAPGVGDVNLDGRPDIVAVGTSTSTFIWLNNGLYPPNVPCHAMGIPNGVQFNVTDTNPTQNLATLPVQDHLCFSIQDFGH